MYTGSSQSLLIVVLGVGIYKDQNTESEGQGRSSTRSGFQG